MRADWPDNLHDIITPEEFDRFLINIFPPGTRPTRRDQSDVVAGA